MPYGGSHPVVHLRRELFGEGNEVQENYCLSR